MHPLLLKHMYEALVLSTALYGSELWNELTDAQLLSLERAHRQCIRFIRNLPRATSTHVVLNCLVTLDIQKYIEKKESCRFLVNCAVQTVGKD